MAKKLAVITGATSGIGEVGATAIARAGYDLVLPCRNLQKGERTRERIVAAAPQCEVTLMACQMDSMKSVADCATKILGEHPRIDLLVNNAGTAEMKFGLSEDGIERTFAINHVSHFILTQKLLPALKAAGADGGARIVHTASEAHYMADKNFVDDINWDRRKYFVFKAYCDSKLANVLFSSKLARELDGTGVVSNCFHPGRVATNIWPGQKWYEKLIFGLLKKIYLISPEKGAKPMIHLALDPSMASVSGVFYFEMKERKVKSFAMDAGLQDRLWEKSRELAKDFI